MNDFTMLVLGGAGNTGRWLGELLLRETPVKLILAGRTLEKARQAATAWNSQYPGERVSARRVDASDSESLKQGLAGVDFALVASSTARYAAQVARAALDAGVDYLDIQYSTAKIQALQQLAPQIEQAGRCFITDGGFHPGLPAALVAYAARQFDALEVANVGSVIKINWKALDLPVGTVIELLEEINDFQALRYRKGQWQKVPLAGMSDYLQMDFGEPFGKQPCMPMFLEEFRSLPAMLPSLQETGFYVGGFNWFTDWVVFPLAMGVLKFWPEAGLEPMGRLLKWSLETFSKPPYETRLKLEARGQKDQVEKTWEIMLTHPDGYAFTAIPVVACLLQYLDGSIRKPGLWTQANLVELGRFIQDIERLGVKILAQ